VAEKPALKPIKGGRTTTKRKKRKPHMRRVVFIPQQRGCEITCIEADTYQPLALLRPIECTVQADGVCDDYDGN
jgi:hypothetical protein